ncbi:hypothetical protein V0R37_19130 [Pollutimonas sp. H1-120]|uniref:hypothetical protein n=1 Tax=Pollutimonas sp. H1-120 TaxID=3148824 RepID=UPI003B529B15
MTEPFILSFHSATLVFGLDWFPLIGARAERLGMRIAKRHRSTHCVLAGEGAGSVGLLALKSGRPQKKNLYSAAQNVAVLFATGTIVLLMELDGAGYWLVAIHEGAVVARTDRFYPSREAADDVLAELRLAYPQLLVLGTPHAPGIPTMAAIEAACSASTQLRRISGWRPFLPWPVQCFVLVLVLALLLPAAWRVLLPDRAEAGAHLRKDPTQAWRDAIAHSAQGRYVHGARGSRMLLETFYALPVNIRGWRLRQAECVPQAVQWQCQARYERQEPDASNRSFLEKIRPEWKVEFTSLDHASAIWRTASGGVPLAHQRLADSKANERHFFSALQGLRAGFADVQVGKTRPLPIPVPMDEQGRPIPRPAQLLAYSSRSVQLSGPLRSAGLLLPHMSFIAWNKAALTLRDINAPSARDSGLTLTLQGVLYENESPATS